MQNFFSSLVCLEIFGDTSYIPDIIGWRPNSGAVGSVAVHGEILSLGYCVCVELHILPMIMQDS